MGRLKELCRLAADMGAEAKLIRVDDIVVRSWTRLKCQYGCGSYGRRLTCPPYTPTPDEFERILQDYKWAILLKFKPGGRSIDGRAYMKP